MSAASDQPVEDYDDGPRGPQPGPPSAEATKPARWALNVSLSVGLVSGVVLACGGLMHYSDSRLRGPAADRMMSSHNLKEIAYAAHNYHDTWGQLPHNTYTPDGKPLLSWRVHLLPYLEHDNIYRMFDLNEPWDGPNNIRLLANVPGIYARPQDRFRPGAMTYYRGFSSPGAVFERRPSHLTPRFLPLLGPYPDPRPGLHLPDFPDGADRTLLVVEAGDPVEWTKPDDLDASPGRPFPKMGGMGWRKVFQAAFADGSVRALRLDTPESTLRALVTHSGGEVLPPDWDAGK